MFNFLGAFLGTLTNLYPDAGRIILDEGTRAFGTGLAATLSMMLGLFMQRVAGIYIPRLYDYLYLDDLHGTVKTSGVICFSLISTPFLIKALFRIFRNAKTMQLAVLVSILTGIFLPQVNQFIEMWFPEWATARKKALESKREETESLAIVTKPVPSECLSNKNKDLEGDTNSKKE